jgi:hypothetical protein
METSEIVLIIGAIATLITVVIGAVATLLAALTPLLVVIFREVKKLRTGVTDVQTVVNSRSDNMALRIEQLASTLRDADVKVPPDPHKTIVIPH